MNPRIKKLWVDALRSGRFIQTRGQLVDPDHNDTYCVMGVLCRLYNDEHPFVQVDLSRSLFSPACVKEWAELTTIFVKPAEIPNECTLVTLNDLRGYTFKQLADLIEAQL